ncbi:MAG TPA: sigma-70 family RNA polymerase sigma factor [Trebonia sp.]|nr:sigma-70 family RNA polymerase sigma factor [Trebonia sp.]
MDREAEFRRLYEANRAAVHAYFTGRTGDRQSAAELMQEVFLRAWQHQEKLADMPDERRRAWLFTVARNLSVDAHRHRHIRAGAEQALAREPSQPPQPASAEIIASERIAVVAEAIRRLPEPQRITLTMAAAGSMTSAELAAVLGVPAGTVRYRLSVARRAVAEALNRYDDPTQE